MLVNNDESASASTTLKNDATFTEDSRLSVIRKPEDGPDAPNAVGTNDGINNNLDSSDEAETYTVMKDILHSLPVMEQDELQKILQQTSELFTQNDDDTEKAKWNANVTEPFWMEYHTQQCRPSAVETNPKEQEYVTHLRQQIQDYQSSQYGAKSNVVAAFNVATITEPAEIYVHTYVEYIDTANCCTARWEVDWTIHILDDLTAKISGTIRIHTHYYENNTNSQIQCQKEVAKNHTVSLNEEKVNSLVAKFEKSTLSYAEKLVTKIVQYIIGAEEEYYVTIVDHLSNDSSTDDTQNSCVLDQLRSLRRILPITKQKFQWHQNQSQQTNKIVQQQQIMMMMRLPQQRPPPK